VDDFNRFGSSSVFITGVSFSIAFFCMIKLFINIDIITKVDTPCS
jgi:hypothetical protein